MKGAGGRAPEQTRRGQRCQRGERAARLQEGGVLSRPELRQKRAREPALRRGAEGQGPHVTSRQTARLRSAGSAPLKLPAHGAGSLVPEDGILAAGALQDGRGAAGSA